MEMQLRREDFESEQIMEEKEEEMNSYLKIKMSSPEAKLGKRVEDLWDNIQEPQLTPTEKLNACFEEIAVDSFPRASFSSVEISSDSSLAEAVQILAQHGLLSAPVVDVNAPKDASWVERYIGVVEFAGIVVWILQQSEADDSSPRRVNGGPALTAASGCTRMGRLANLSPRSAAVISGNYFGTLTSSDLYKSTKVRDIAGSFRWAPFLALQNSNTMLTVMLLLSQYKMKSVPVVDPGDAKINNIITQSAVIHMLAECVGLQWFDTWGNKTLSELGLPLMSRKHIVYVSEDEPVLQAFKLMRLKGVGGIPVVERNGSKAIGNISLRDVQYLLIAPEIYMSYRSITAKDFLAAARKYREERQEVLPSGGTTMFTCNKDDSLKDVIQSLDSIKIHRIYVVDSDGNLEGVITLRDIISKLVNEPRNYFGDFFDGYSPNIRR